MLSFAILLLGFFLNFNISNEIESIFIFSQLIKFAALNLFIKGMKIPARDLFCWNVLLECKKYFCTSLRIFVFSKPSNESASRRQTNFSPETLRPPALLYLRVFPSATCGRLFYLQGYFKKSRFVLLFNLAKT